MGKAKSLNTSESSLMSSTPTRAKRRKRSTINNSMNSTRADYSNLASDLETHEIVGKLRSMEEAERLACVEMLSKVFADPESNIVEENPSLWTDFLTRFCDVSRSVRSHMVDSCVDIFANRLEFRKDISESLVQRTRDPEDEIRRDAIISIAAVVKDHPEYISEEILSVLKERTLDKKFKVRHEALLTLASFYRDANSGKMEGELERFDWIKNKILHVYYQCGIEDKLLCEKLLYTSLVPYLVSTEPRMDALFKLYCSIDEHALKAFNEILKQQRIIRSLVKVILEHLKKKSDEKEDDEIAIKLRNLADRFPNPSKAAEQLRDFFEFLTTDRRAFQLVEIMVGEDYTTTKIGEAIKELFMKVGPGSKLSNLQTISRSLLERCAPVIIDAAGIKLLVEKAMGTLECSIEVDAVPYEQQLKRAFNLLLIISYSFPGGYESEEVLLHLLMFLRHGNSLAASVSLQILSNGAKEREGLFPENIVRELLPELKCLATNGLPKHAKNATICICRISQKISTLRELFEEAKNELTLANEHIETVLAFITTVAMVEPVEFKRELAVAAKLIVTDIVLNSEYAPSNEDIVGEWQPLENLPLDTRAKVAGIKFLPRWILGQNSNENDIATKAISLLCAIIHAGGDVKNNGKFSNPERNALKVAAAKALIKMLQHKIFVNLLSMEQYRVIAKLIADDCRQVREKFVAKLQNALRSLKLPLEFLAMYSLAPTLQASSNEDEDKVNAYKRNIQTLIGDNIIRRRQFLQKNPTVHGRLQEYLPEYYLSFVIHLLSYHPKFEAYDDADGLQEIQECLWFAMDPLLAHSQQDVMNQQFLHKMFQDIKQTKNAEDPENEEQNKKMWAVSDLAIVLLSRRVPHMVIKDTTYKSILARKCFTSPLKTKTNTEVYLRKEFLTNKGNDKDKSFNQSGRKSTNFSE